MGDEGAKPKTNEPKWDQKPLVPGTWVKAHDLVGHSWVLDAVREAVVRGKPSYVLAFDAGSLAVKDPAKPPKKALVGTVSGPCQFSVAKQSKEAPLGSSIAAQFARSGLPPNGHHYEVAEVASEKSSQGYGLVLRQLD
jgi:hypothetical protein